MHVVSYRLYFDRKQYYNLFKLIILFNLTISDIVVDLLKELFKSYHICILNILKMVRFHMSMQFNSNNLHVI